VRRFKLKISFRQENNHCVAYFDINGQTDKFNEGRMYFFEGIQSYFWGYEFATEEYIRIDITTQQYHDVLYDVTVSKYCNKSMDKISLPRIVDERIYPELWVKSLTFKGMADEIKNAGKQVYYWNNEDGISPELLK
jgi:hypothetical protein